MVIKIGQKRMLLKIHQGRAADDSSCEMAVHGGTQWTPKKQKKKMEDHETYVIYKISLSLMNRLFRLQEPGKSFPDEYLHKIVTLKGLVFSDQMETTVKNRMRNKTNENFYWIWFHYCITCIEETSSWMLIQMGCLKNAWWWWQ